jgi:hypothetical protein
MLIGSTVAAPGAQQHNRHSTPRRTAESRGSTHDTQHVEAHSSTQGSVQLMPEWLRSGSPESLQCSYAYKLLLVYNVVKPLGFEGSREQKSV